ncbi:hypothetical protein LPB138_02355 [Urechidicola croceus]|uniref:Type I restriction modification DNA specificity domain-containing protein n=1 Tax=Urechidicola croceus TaxID=1850246 RepID=A0A1D8PBV8_9FLAO|nr:hypothetical protein LPB138_02355 [Urechidicola croceus]
MPCNDVSLTPKLRFKEFEGDWEKKKIGEVLKIGSGRDYKHLNKGQIPVYGTGGLMTYVDEYLYEGESVCIGRKGTIDKPVYLNEKFWTVDTLFYTHSFKNSIPKFIFRLFERINWKLYNEASGVPSLSKSTIEKIKFSTPSLPEQQKIASFLTAVDTKIQQLTRKKELLEQYKKGVMQKIFNQELRFKPDNANETSLREPVARNEANSTQSVQNETDFPDWEEKKLGDVCDVNPKNHELPNSFVYIDLESVESGRLVFQNRIDLSEAPSRAQRLLKVNDLLFQTVRPYQMNNLFFNKEGDYVASTGYAQLRVKESAMFLYQLLHTNEFVNNVLERCTGTSYPAINSKDLSKLKIKVPSLKEQQKIATYLSAIDRKIETVNNQISHTQTFKKGLLQQLFV